MEEDISVFILYDSLNTKQKKWLGSGGQETQGLWGK